jgi:hypothetical protein
MQYFCIWQHRRAGAEAFYTSGPLLRMCNWGGDIFRRGPGETSIYMHGLTIISIRHREADQAHN